MKFSMDWLSDFVDVAAAGGAEQLSKLLDQAGFPLESRQTLSTDTILDVEITPNRPDAMGHRGLAREVAAMAGLPMRDLEARYAEPESEGVSTEELASIVIQAPKQCRRFGARVVRAIGTGPAPDWVRKRLAAIGAKSISAAVDATNYVLWDTAQPLHAFDLDKLAGGMLIVRKATRGESLVTLDGVERVLEPSDVVVADAERPVSLAGIMGGLDTAVTPTTRNILLEAAWWEPTTIRQTARRLGMHTDASHRFERGADFDAIPGALNLAARLLTEAAGGTVAPGFLDAHGSAFRARRTWLRLQRLRLLSGDSRLTLDFAEEALQRLSFTTERKGKRLNVRIPFFRTDVRREDDLVEEILRVYGYDRLPSRLPATATPGDYTEPLRRTEERLSDIAAAAGLFETIQYPFVDRDTDETAWGDWLRITDTALEPLAIVNPLDASRRHLRATLLPGLLDALARNIRRGASGAALFEVGRAFGEAGDPDLPESYESRRFAFALAGEYRGHWSIPEVHRTADFFDAKGLIEALLAPWLPASALAWKPLQVQALIPGACATVETRSGVLLGVAGQVSGPERQKRDLPAAAFAGEILIQRIPTDEHPFEYREFSTLPVVTADISFSQPKDLSWESIEALVREASLENLESLTCHDRYEGAGVPEGFVKTTVRMRFRSAERTLERDEVNRQVQRLAEELRSRPGITLSGWGKE
ncbi:MAG: phenylalanine--tRNA ligase subunit beta [Acidobacteriota bacterium]